MRVSLLKCNHPGSSHRRCKGLHLLKVELDSLEGCGIGGNRIISSRILQQNLPEEIDEYGEEEEESEDQLV
jgi:hypothetical protein